MILRISILITTCFLIATNGISQQLDYVQGELIVQMVEKANPTSLKALNLRSRSSSPSFSAIEGSPFNLFIVSVDYKTINEVELVRTLQKDPNVLLVQRNKIISQRAIPNDTLYNRQWQYLNTSQSGGKIGADIKAQDAWDITTGGTTALGDEIVVCVVDDGYDLNHEDLIDNLWYNKEEIDGDGIDNDNNGFIDDIYGWNFNDSNKDISPNGVHGSPVAGIIGAKGNNKKGVTGINWDVKIMAIKYDAQITESTVLQSYSYAYAKRKKYNETNGQKGAFVVAINSSWGINNADPNDSPIWCNFYDALGEIGILSCGATANRNSNVDITGDMPTGCTSRYLVAVTNTDDFDDKVNSAGYGRKSIDLSAPGTKVYTLATNNNYSTFGGTSSSTPHVTGAVGLLYSVPCSELINIAKTNPALAAITVKEMILNTVDELTVLNGITTSRGRLNIANAVKRVNDMCKTNGDTYGFTVTPLTNGNTSVSFSSNKSGLITDLRYRPENQITWTEHLNITSGFQIQNLKFCQEYEYQVRSHLNGIAATYGYSQFFTSKGCCFVSQVDTAIVSNGSVTFELSNIETSVNNTFEYRKLGETNWQTAIAAASITISGFQECDLIEYRISTMCTQYQTQSDTSKNLYFSFDCGECTTHSYCEVVDFNNNEEWINSVTINGETFESGQGASSYNNFTGGFIPKVKKEKPIVITLEPGHKDQTYSERFHIFIDLNQDGIFNSATEKTYDSNIASQNAVTDTMYIPSTALKGITRMRVVMIFNKQSEPCGQSGDNYGEIEDYCIQIEESLGTTTEGLTPTSLVILPNISESVFNLKLTIPGLTDGKVEVYNINGQKVYSKQTGKSTDLILNAIDWKAGTYIVKFSSKLGSLTQRIVKI